MRRTDLRRRRWKKQLRTTVRNWGLIFHKKFLRYIQCSHWCFLHKIHRTIWFLCQYLRAHMSWMLSKHQTTLNHNCVLQTDSAKMGHVPFKCLYPSQHPHSRLTDNPSCSFDISLLQQSAPQNNSIIRKKLETYSILSLDFFHFEHFPVILCDLLAANETFF